MNTNVLFCFLVTILPVAASEMRLVITFDGPPAQPVGTDYAVRQYQESGLVFKPLGPLDAVPPFRMGRCGGGISFFPENGSAYLQPGLGEPVEIFTTDQSSFDFLTVDLAEYSTVFPIPITIMFFGFKANGQMVFESFTTDGIIDGTGPLQDFQTFAFGPKFKHLVRVEIMAEPLPVPFPPYQDASAPFALDNLTVLKSHAPGLGQ
jgi:hypothetical protein